MSKDDKKSVPKLNRFTDGPNDTRMIANSHRELFEGGPEQWIKAIPARYQIQGPVGQGGMGQVYLATDVGETGQGARQVAIKLVLSKFVGNKQAYERFVQEMHIAEQLDHENIVQVLTHGRTSQGIPYLVMQFIEGGSLLDRISSKPSIGLPVDEVIDIGMQVCAALMVAHDFGVIHRDIKPGNILVRQERYPRPRLIVKLADFGLARSLETSNHSMSAMVGTFGYRSPEQRSGGRVDARSDLYSLGATLFHACSGEAPEGPSDWEEVPEVLRLVLSKSLSKKASDRYANAVEMYEALDSCRSERAISPMQLIVPEPSSVPTKPLRPLEKKLVVSAAVKTGIIPAIPAVSNTLVLPVDLTNSLGMKFRLIEPGTFMMGSTSHQVTLTQRYYMGVYTVTQSEYQQIMGRTLSKFQGDRHPVEQVSWQDAEEFAKTLTGSKEEKIRGRQYRLPTEAEWEYACRAGSRTKYCFSENKGHLADYAWFHGNSGGRTHPVGQKKPNAWGLYDMHGNVWEWCSDWYGSYPSASVTNPTGASAGTERVRRGGSWNDVAEYCASGFRRGYDPSQRFISLGFRMVLNLL